MFQGAVTSRGKVARNVVGRDMGTLELAELNEVSGKLMLTVESERPPTSRKMATSTLEVFGLAGQRAPLNAVL